MSNLNVFKARARTNRPVITLLASGALGCSALVHGHHSFEAHFRTDETVTVGGVVTEFWFANPHARIYLDVTDEDGEVTEWMAEGGSRNVLTRRGWSEDTIRPGMVLIVSGNPSRDGSNAIGWQSLTGSDGSAVQP